MDVTPLQSLPFLQDLQLTKGHFYYLEYTDHLSSLHLTAAVPGGHWACNCMNTLHSLTIVNSRLSGIPTLGLKACIVLRNLACRNSIIEATHPYESCMTSAGAPTRVPLSVGAMCNSTNLLFSFEGLQIGNCDVSRIDWVCELTNLRSLCLIYNEQIRHVWLSRSLTQLKVLGSVEMRASAEKSRMSL